MVGVVRKNVYGKSDEKYNIRKADSMNYIEKIQDLFSVPEDYYLVHCISADFALGKGIALEFKKRFDMKNLLNSQNPDYLEQWIEIGDKADCILIGRVFNLVTKERYFHKPTYKTLQWSLQIMYNICKSQCIKKIAMPLIGCGLDGLKWDKVSEIIKECFADTDCEILVCKQ